MRKINKLIIHCSATKEGDDVSVDTIRKWHKKRGFRDIGYHYVIGIDGVLFNGRPIEQMGAHCTGHNKDSIGICYVGGLNSNGKPKDTRTEAQKYTMNKLITELKKIHMTAIIKGHRDYSPDLNDDGKIDKWEWVKVCPCFEVSNEF